MTHDLRRNGPLCALWLPPYNQHPLLFFQLKLALTHCGTDEALSGSLDCWQFCGVPSSVNCCKLLSFHTSFLLPWWAAVSPLPCHCVILGIQKSHSGFLLCCYTGDLFRDWGKPRCIDMKGSLLFHFQSVKTSFETLRRVLPKCFLSWLWPFYLCPWLT